MSILGRERVNSLLFKQEAVTILTVGRDGNIRYFEYENDKFEYLSEYKSPDPQRGIAFMPKRGVNMHENEVMRAYKTVNDSYIEPISFIVPRRAEVFQDDIYPPCTGVKPAMSSGEWLGGKEGIAPKIDLGSLYEGEGLKEIAVEPPKAAAAAPAPVATPATPVIKELVPEPKAPSPTISSGPPPSFKQQSSSIAAIASKYADNGDDKAEDADEISSFEEVSKPTDRFASSPSDVERPDAKPTEAPKAEPLKVDTKPSDTKADDKGAPVPDSATVHREMMTMKSLLDEQTRTLAAQTEQMQTLTAEIESLKAKLG